MESSFLKSFFLLTTVTLSSSLMFPNQACAQDNSAAWAVKPSYNYNYLTGWHGYVGVDYQQFSNNGTTFAQTTYKSYNIDPNYHAGFNLGLGYEVPIINTDVNLNYTHLHTSDSSTAWAPSLDIFPDSLGPVTWARGSVRFNYDSVNLTAGHMVQITNNFAVNYYGGLNYTHLKKDMTTYGTGLGNTITTQVGTTYNGIGPTFGLDGYCTPFNSYPNFNVFGGFQPSMLYGTMSGYVKNDFNNVFTSDSIPNEKIVVPALGANLGLNYFQPYRNAKIDFKLGYQFTQYFGVTRDSSYNNSINASFQGPYFNVGAAF